MENIPKLRFAHPTDNLERSIFFYRDGLGFEILDRYTEQQGWDGVIFGHRDWPYQIQISQKRGTDPVPRNATVNHFLVFSLPEAEHWERRLKALFDAGFTQVPVPELYNDGASACYEDPDGYRVVLRKGFWKK